jgi:hypothetical protein
MGSFIEDHVQPRWPRYGLKGDPFFSNPLDPDDDTNRPITLFKGRTEERRRLDQVIVDGGHSATLIYAAGGYGKTTLANAVSYDLEQEGYLVLPGEIVFREEAGVDGFFCELLHGILQAVSDEGYELPSVPGDPREIQDADAAGLRKARMAVQLTRVRSEVGAGASVAGTGAQGSVSYGFLRPAFQRGASRALLRDVMADARALVGEGLEVVVRVNNLDVAVKKDRAAVEQFLLEARDLFQVDGLHFLFMGNALVRDAIEQEPRVQSVFQEPLPLEPLSLEDVFEVLSARYRFLSIEGSSVVQPVADELVEELYEVHRGDLRNVLRDLRRSVQSVDPVEAEPVIPAQALPLLEDAHFGRLDNQLTREHWKTLKALDDEGEARQVDLAENIEVGKPTMSRRFTKFEEMGVVDLERIEGPSKFYRLPGNTRLALRGARRAGIFEST